LVEVQDFVAVLVPETGGRILRPLVVSVGQRDELVRVQGGGLLLDRQDRKNEGVTAGGDSLMPSPAYGQAAQEDDCGEPSCQDAHDEDALLSAVHGPQLPSIKFVPAVAFVQTRFMVTYFCLVS
jgi:hypothetical protein